MKENSKFIISENNIKKFRYRLGDFQGARLKYELSEFKSYKKINTDGFIIYNSNDYYIDFSVDNQLIRKLKLKNLTNQIKNNSKEDKLLRLINLSTIIESEGDSLLSFSYQVDDTYIYNYSPDCYVDVDVNVIDRREQKRYQHYQSKQISQMINRYSKKGYRR